VSIPFVGEADTFRYHPSRWTVPNNRVSIGSNALKVTVPDDENADRAIEQFKSFVDDNLNLLRAEYEQLKPQLEQAIQQAANRRKTQIDAENARDKTRSFRVTN
jgi:hypothetical protein